MFQTFPKEKDKQCIFTLFHAVFLRFVTSQLCLSIIINTQRNVHAIWIWLPNHGSQKRFSSCVDNLT